MANEITMAEDILRHVHTAELYKTAQGGACAVWQLLTSTD